MKSYLHSAKLGLLAKKTSGKHKKGGATWFGILVSFLIIVGKAKWGRGVRGGRINQPLGLCRKCKHANCGNCRNAGVENVVLLL